MHVDKLISHLESIANQRNQSLKAEDVRTLVRYAESSIAPEEADEAKTLILRLLHAIAEPLFGPHWATPLPPHWQNEQRVADPLEREVARLFRCAMGYLCLARGEPVPRAWLAAIADLSKASIGQAVFRKNLVASPGKRRRRSGTPSESPILYESAKKWLLLRGITISSR